MEAIYMSYTDNKNSRRRRSNYRYDKPRYWEIGSKVWLNASTLLSSKDIYLCEARVVRHPLFIGGPYKVVIVGVRLLTRQDSSDPKIYKLLGLKLRKSEDSLIRTRNAFSMHQNEVWVAYTESQSSKAVQRAIAYIKKDKNDQAKGKYAWLNTRK